VISSPPLFLRYFDPALRRVWRLAQPRRVIHNSAIFDGNIAKRQAANSMVLYKSLPAPKKKKSGPLSGPDSHFAKTLLSRHNFIAQPKLYHHSIAAVAILVAALLCRDRNFY
jgi:hypothetical protein